MELEPRTRWGKVSKLWTFTSRVRGSGFRRGISSLIWAKTWPVIEPSN